MANLPLQLNADTIPVLLKAMGTPLKGDAQLHLLAEMPFRIADIVTNATVTTAAVAAGFSSDDSDKLTKELTKRKGGK